MHRSHGTLPVSGGRPPRRGRGEASAKGRASSGLPATPEALRLTEAASGIDTDNNQLVPP